MEEMALQESLFWHSSHLELCPYASHMHIAELITGQKIERNANAAFSCFGRLLAVGLAPGTRGAEAAEAFSSAELLAEVARIRLQTQKPDTACVWLAHLAMHRCLTAQRPKGDSIKAGPVVLGCSSTPMQLHPLSLM